MKPRTILTFDLEFWYNSLLLENYLPKNKNSLPDYTKNLVEPVLNLLKQNKIRATFFSLGKLAERYPDVIKKIFNMGHELASHGYSHKCLWDLNEESFEKEIRLTNQIIKDITGISIRGFRAPNFSLNKKTEWAIPILERNGFQYDSSIFPMKTPLYGNDNAPLVIHKIANSLVEFPPAVFAINRIKFPVGGGFYFRITPIKPYIYFIKKISKKRIPVLYFHPHELYGVVPETKGIPWLHRKINFYGVRDSFRKFEILLKNFDFISIEDYLSVNKL
jgi:polysaccharide deacetylase family protein (PEP-CTERM system associated)